MYNREVDDSQVCYWKSPTQQEVLEYEIMRKKNNKNKSTFLKQKGDNPGLIFSVVLVRIRGEDS